MNAITTKHNLNFEVAESPYNAFDVGTGHKMFRIGTCEGQWGSTHDSYYIISVKNSCRGNGHLDDVFEWFEYSCKRDNRNLIVVECMNKNFYRHLLIKRGFFPLDSGGDNCIKVFNIGLYDKLKKDGNEILIAGTLKCV